jgi:hypothetical protein
MSKHIAVLARQPHTRRQIARALYSGGLELRFLEGGEDLERSTADGMPELFILDVDSIPVQDLRGCLTQLGPRRVPVVLLSMGSNKEALLELLQSYDVANLVAKHGAIRAVYPVVDERELMVTCQKVTRQDIFGLEKYIGAWGVKVHAYLVRSMAEKQQLITDFEGYLTDLECPPGVVPDILTVADELVVNALVHAPRDAKGRPKYEHIGPVPDLEVDPQDAVEVRWACDGQRMMFSATDPFGALTREHVYRYVSKGFGGGRHAVEEKAGGAGLGLAMSLKRLHQLVINVQDGVRTEVVAGWYLRVDTASDFRQVSKSINVFWLPRDARPLLATPEPSVPTPPELPRIRPPPRPAPGPAAAPAPAVGRSAPRAAPQPEPAQKGRRMLCRLSGRINERFKPEVPRGVPLRLDVRGVTSFSSAGVIRWLDWVRTLSGRSVEVVACPEVVVRAANEVEGLLGTMRIRSVLAPFECPSCLQAFQYEVAPAAALEDVARLCPGCGSTLRFAGVAHEYRGFLELVAP